MNVVSPRRRPLASAFRRVAARVARVASALSIGMFVLWPSPLALQAATVQDSNYFFRLTSKYMHGNEPVEFDIVVGCGVRVTLSDAVGSSYDAFRDPLFYVKATKDGAAVLQIVPDACQGQTTDNGRVPKDFLPGAIWFDKKDDFLLGIAYIAEDAFENPKAKLKFVGAAIHPATRAEWEAFRPINAQNLLSPRWFSHHPAPLQSGKSRRTCGTGRSCSNGNLSLAVRALCAISSRSRRRESYCNSSGRLRIPDSGGHPRTSSSNSGNDCGH